MNIYVKALIEKYNAEEVAGVLIATINGKRETIAKVTDMGFDYTPVGKMYCSLDDEAEVAKIAEPPKRLGRPPKPKLGLADYTPGMNIGE